MFRIDDLFAQLKEGPSKPATYIFGATTKYTEYTTLLQQGNYGAYLLKIANLNLDSYPGNYMDRLTFLVTLIIRLRDSPDDPLKERAVRATIEKWQSPQDDDPSGVIADLINSILCPLDAIKMLLTLYYDDITPMELIESQVTSDENKMNLNLMLNRIATLFKDTTSKRNVIDTQEMQYLKFIAEKHENASLLEWVNNKLENELVIAERPPWVNLLSGETSAILNPDNWVPLRELTQSIPNLDTQSIVDMIKENFVLNPKDNPEEDVDEATITQVVDAATQSSRFASLLNSEINSEVKYPTDPDRMFGPVNKRNDGEECVSSIVKGGCRMLSCRCRDFDQSDDAEPTDKDPQGWFDGICDGCNRTIIDISWCLRYPIIGGGYVGCFCSTDCLKIKPSRELSQIGELTIDNVFATIEEKGIVNRHALITPEEPKKEMDDFIYETSAQKFLPGGKLPLPI